jgi:hypothetical protein
MTTEDKHAVIRVSIYRDDMTRQWYAFLEGKGSRISPSGDPTRPAMWRSREAAIAELPTLVGGPIEVLPHHHTWLWDATVDRCLTCPETRSHDKR